MNRRTFVVSALSLSVSGVVAGCLGDDDGEDEGEDEDEDFEPGDANSRQVVIESEHLLRRSDSLIRQDGSVFVTVRLENAGTEPVSADVTLEIHDRDGEPLGTPFTQERGPIEPGRTVQILFETALDPQAVGGYALTVTEADASDGEDTADGDDSGQDSGNETQDADSDT
ncbi:MAG: FxLYD domain-containing protein [Natrialbaceae archaeon]